MFPDPLLSRAADLFASCRTKGLTVATAESCTGGLLAALITAIPGSSGVFERGFVTYSNAAKIECLGVSPRMLEDFGAVSAEAARAMAEGALAHSSADIALSITGIAGPGGGSPGKARRPRAFWPGPQRQYHSRRRNTFRRPWPRWRACRRDRHGDRAAPRSGLLMHARGENFRPHSRQPRFLAL